MAVSTWVEASSRAVLCAALLAVAGCSRENGSVSGNGLAKHDSFFVVTGSHKTLSCDQCHDPAAPGFALAEQGVSCTGCHTDAATTPAHGGVAGYTWSTGTCIGCHKDGSGGLPANHNTDFFPVTGTKHASLGCADCHGATKQIADITCTPCHAQAPMATAHSAIPATKAGSRDRVTYVNYQWASAYCLKCHANGQVDRIASHPRFDHGLTGSGHAPFCLTCHTASAPPGGKAWAVSFGTYSCLACHTSNNPG
ncbi:MAG: cytochrome c3 family protein [Myxococcales bacterium]